MSAFLQHAEMLNVLVCAKAVGSTMEGNMSSCITDDSAHRHTGKRGKPSGANGFDMHRQTQAWPLNKRLEAICSTLLSKLHLHCLLRHFSTHSKEKSNTQKIQVI